jgi:hypothetical protein
MEIVEIAIIKLELNVAVSIRQENASCEIPFSMIVHHSNS